MGRNFSLHIDIANLAVGAAGLLIAVAGFISWRHIFPPPWSEGYFYCSPRSDPQLESPIWTVMYEKNGVHYPWLKIFPNRDNTSPKANCVKVAQRLETYRVDGLIEFGYDNQSPPVLCAKTRLSKNSCLPIYVLTTENPELEFYDVVQPLLDDSAFELSNPPSIPLDSHFSKED